jgi:hypothetical protein
VYTVEISQRYYGFVRARFTFNGSVHCHQGDSRPFLRRVLPLVSAAPAFFYLDAHWEADLPLREEVEIIFEGHQQAVVMIDDFQVPGDSGYEFDDYGNGQALTLDYLRAPLEDFGLEAYFPASTSSRETGVKRGCIVLARDPMLVARISGMSTLKALQPTTGACERWSRS